MPDKELLRRITAAMDRTEFTPPTTELGGTAVGELFADAA